jgi:hypothetical protein
MRKLAPIGWALVAMIGSVASHAQGLSAAVVAQGFSDAVIAGCADAAEAGKSIEALKSPAIVPDNGPRGPLTPGAKAWAPVKGQGIVTIDETSSSCMVSAYGPPVEDTFREVSEALKARGYLAIPGAPEPPKLFSARLEKLMEGKTVMVNLSGNEPGAAGRMSRFSTLLAIVRVMPR